MAPLTPTFPPSHLTEKLQFLPNGKLRKPALQLHDCALKEMLQYSCELDGPKEEKGTKVVCEPVLRVFRRCANGVVVETTSWEGVHGEGW